MYCKHFGLECRPFDVRGESDFFIADPQISQDLVRLGAALTSRGSLVAVTGGPGFGKTAIIEEALRPFAEQVVIARPDVRYADHEELFALVLAEFGIPSAKDDAAGLRDLRDFTRQAHQSGQQPLVSLDAPVFTTAMAKKLLRLAMTGGDLENPLNIALQGPHRIQKLLNVAGLMHLRQRLVFRYRVEALNAEQTSGYIIHRLQSAGGDAEKILQDGVCEKIHIYAGGVPRLINTLTDAVLTETFVNDASQVTVPVLDEVARGLEWKSPAPTTKAGTAPAAGRGATTITKKPSSVSGNAQTAKGNGKPASLAAVPLKRAPAAVKSVAAPATQTAAAGQLKSVLRLEEDSTPAEKPGAEVAAGEAESPTGMTGKLRLEDLDDRLAETFFTEDPEMIKNFRRMADEKSADDKDSGR